MSILQFYRSSPDAICPTKGSSGAAGYDLSSAETFVILARDRAKIATGLHIAVPSGYYARIAPRSGLALKYGLDTGAGVIDQGHSFSSTPHSLSTKLTNVFPFRLSG